MRDGRRQARADPAGEVEPEPHTTEHRLSGAGADARAVVCAEGAPLRRGGGVCWCWLICREEA